MASRLFFALVSWFDSDEELVPFVMFAGGRGTAAGKGSVQDLDVGDQVLFHPSPVGELVTAGTSDLICEELDYAVVDPVVVRFDNALPILIDQPDETCFVDGLPELRIDVRLECRQHSRV